MFFLEVEEENGKIIVHLQEVIFVGLGNNYLILKVASYQKYKLHQVIIF